jgi:outer membrane protein TolC
MAMLICWLLLAVSAGSPPLAPEADEPAPEVAPALPPAASTHAIDLDTALRLAQVENPTIAEARVAIQEALARQALARLLLVPTLNAGLNYHGHAGNLQRSSGVILKLYEQSFYVGGGARTLAAESLAIPAVNIASPLADAIFEPLAARQRVAAAQFQARATANSILRDVSVLYLDLVAARAILDAQRLSLAQLAQVVQVTRAFAEVGEGREADAERARAEWALLAAEVQRAEGELLSASARLAERLNLDPALRLVPPEAPIAPITLIDDQTPLPVLLGTALAARPELGAATARIGEADARYREERWRPLLPTLWLGFSGGYFGGGSNLVKPTIGNFGGRNDFDVRAYWTLLNFGAGNLALQKRRRAEVGQAFAERTGLINLVRREVAAAQAGSLAARSQIEVRREAVGIAEQGFLEDLDRARFGEARPIEVLNNLRLLAEARVNLIDAVIRYNQQQFRLFVALGSPPPMIEPSPLVLGPPPAVSVPLHSPFRVHF